MRGGVRGDLKTFACIATVPERIDLMVQAKASLAGQVDVIHVHRNEAWGELPGDSAKFSSLAASDADFYFTCDDDLIYAPFYVDRMARLADLYDAVVTLHGGVYFPGIQDKFYYGHVKKYRCLIPNEEASFVHVPGSGVSCIPRRLQKPIAEAMGEITIPNAADLYLGRALARIGEPAVVVQHDGTWVRDLPTQRNIWGEINRGVKDETVQVQLLNEVMAHADLYV